MKNKFQTALMGAAGALLMLAACTSDTLPEVMPPATQDGDVNEVLFVTRGFVRDGAADSRTSTTPKNDGATFAWVAQTDTIGILPDAGSQVYFVIDQVDDTDAGKAKFTGGAWGLKSDNEYTAYYPFIQDIMLKRTAVPVDYTGQVHTGTVTMDKTTTQNMARYTYMAAKAVKQESGALNFSFSHLCALVEVKVAIPTAGSVNRLVLSADEKVIPVKGTFDLTAEAVAIASTDEDKDYNLSIDVKELKTTTDGETVSIFFMMPPMADVKTTDLKATVFYGEDNTGLPLTISTENTLRAGLYYTLETQTIIGQPDAIAVNEVYGFSGAINDALGKLGGTKLRFVAGSVVTSDVEIYLGETSDEDAVKAYAVRNGDWLEVHTLAKKFTLPGNCDNMFNSDYFPNFKSLEALDLSALDTSSVTVMTYMFNGCSSLTSLDLSKFDTQKVEYMNLMFQGCSSLTTLDLSNFDTSKITDMRYMFYNCSALESITFGDKFDTSKVETMFSMFDGCSSLTTLDLSKFNTSSVTNMNFMFFGCSSLTTLDLSEFDTSSVTNMSGMFYSCSSLTTLDLSKFDTSSVTDMSDMFYSCSSLTTLDLSEFDTSSVTNMSYMFYDCSSLITLDLSSFTFADGVTCTVMFYGVGTTEKKTTIYVSSEGKTYLEKQDDTYIDSSTATLTVKTGSGDSES